MDSKPGGGGDREGPEIIRPIPRRPFALNFSVSTPTPPPDVDDSAAFPSSNPDTPQRPQQGITARDLRFLLDPRNYGSHDSKYNRSVTPGESSSSVSRATSFLNLTSSTLLGIYSPGLANGTSLKGPGDYFDERDEDEEGADADCEGEGEAEGLDVDMGGRRRESAAAGRAASFKRAAAEPRVSGVAVAVSLVLRAVLLFALGMGYGALVTRLPKNGGAGAGAQELNWRYLVFWGGAGVALGSLLPWFDRVWEESFGRPAAPRKSSVVLSSPTAESTVPATPAKGTTETEQEKRRAAAPEADWALVVRGIGAFVGIVFAIRKLPWASTMQVSLTLALANPFLWYLIDRSKPGFLLSAAVGLAGSVTLMRLNPDMVPAPRGYLASHLTGTAANGTASASGGHFDTPGTVMQGLASQETIETSIWMLSVLFCSCVCFGNIGRRLALTSSAAAREGRWVVR